MNVNLNNVTSLNPPPLKKKGNKRDDPKRIIMKDASGLKAKKMHFMDQLPKITKSEGGTNFVIFQPNRNNNMN